MSKYVFPAVFTPEGEFYVVDFPDIPNCYTQGEGLNDALEMANDVLCLTLYHMEKEGKTIPLPSDIHDIKINENNSFVSLVGCDTFEYQKFYENGKIRTGIALNSALLALSLIFLVELLYSDRHIFQSF